MQGDLPSCLLRSVAKTPLSAAIGYLRQNIAPRARRAQILLHQQTSTPKRSTPISQRAYPKKQNPRCFHRGFRIYLFHILAPEEMELEDRGLVSYVDLETRRRIVTHTRDLRLSYSEAMHTHLRNLRTLSRQRQIHHQIARTDTHYFKLFDVLANRPR